MADETRAARAYLQDIWQQAIEAGVLAQDQSDASAQRMREIERNIDRAGEYIDRLEDGHMRAILRGRYLIRLSWSRIRGSLGISESYCMRLHKRALQALAEVMQKEGQD